MALLAKAVLIIAPCRCVFQIRLVGCAGLVEFHPSYLGILFHGASYVVPTVDMVRTYLNEPVTSPVIYLKNEITITQTDLKKYDEKYGVANQ